MNRASPLLFLVAGLALAGCATGGRPTILPADRVTLESGRRIHILRAYLAAGDGPAVVRGQVRRNMPWLGSPRGHLHVTAFGASGVVIARRTVRWDYAPGGRHPPPSAYHADLGVPKAEVTGLKVAFAPEAHLPVEGFQ